MDLLSLGVILLILVASGGIAFVADGLGKKIGKKRLSVAGLRPKHVAQIGTVGMGVLVSALTIGFIMAVSRDAREWLVEGRGLLLQKKQLKRDNADLLGLNKGYKAESDLLRKQNDRDKRANQWLIGRNTDLRTNLDREKMDLQKERIDLATLKVEQTSLRAEKDRLGGQVTNLREGLRTTRRTLDESRARLLVVRTSLKTYQAAVRTAQASVDTAKRNLALAKHDLGVQVTNNNQALKQNQDLNFKNRDLAEKVETGEASVRELTAKRDAAQTALDAAQQRLDGTNTELDRVAAQVSTLYDIEKRQEEFLAGTVRTSRTGRMVFNKDEEVARVVIPANATRNQATDAVQRLLRLARIEAEGRGAKAHRANGESFEAADLVPRKDPKTGQTFDADAVRQRVVASVTGRRNDEALVATSSLNAFAGEVVSLEVAAVPNPVVYRRNDTVAEAQIDGSQTEERILSQLADFYHGRVREQAVQDHMIPRSGSLAPFGEIPDAQVLDLVQNVKRMGRPVRVRAVAKDDVRAADPLRLEFVVR